MFFRNKKGVSVVLSNLLMILIVVVSVSALGIALVPVIKKSFSGFGNCIDAQNSIDIVNTRLTCFDIDDNLGGLTIKVKKKDLKKFRIALTNDFGAVTIFDVVQGDNPAGFGMFGRGIPGVAGSQQIQFPDALQQLNYVAVLSSGSAFVKVEVSPVVKKDICNVDDVVELKLCDGDINLAQEPPINVNVQVI